ncbi:hypothetical protein HHK36_032576 [Tetracentron sinense]|uniref:Sulfite oxidase n=1 Tax=Tetracentron sinense TaxID=13715 RepID=A0A835CXJ2_TETSI|nr:hypothetical protein HHK36_032576 [Tetracentron sinense]
MVHEKDTSTNAGSRLARSQISGFSHLGWGQLADVLELVGIPKLTTTTTSGGKHVELNISNPVLNEVCFHVTMPKPLNRDHGYPLRSIVPGVIGARSVKWLDSINIIAEECQGFFMQKDYKMFPPSVNWENIDWSTRRPQMDFPVQCAICSLEDVNVVKHEKITISGYAVSGGGRGIDRVDLSIDGGKTWVEASRYQTTGIKYIAGETSSDKWAWVFFTAKVDTAANVQPENVDVIWNLRGILNTSWHRVDVRVGHSNL